MLFPKALFLATNFPKYRQNFRFSIEFSSQKLKILSKFPQPILFVQTRENLIHSFEIFWKIGKIMHFVQFSKEPFCKFSKILRSRGRGSAPRSLYYAVHNLEPPPRRNFICVRHWYSHTEYNSHSKNHNLEILWLFGSYSRSTSRSQKRSQTRSPWRSRSTMNQP